MGLMKGSDSHMEFTSSIFSQASKLAEGRWLWACTEEEGLYRDITQLHKKYKLLQNITEGRQNITRESQGTYRIPKLVSQYINITVVTTYNKSSGTGSTGSTNGARNASGARETRSPSNTREALWEGKKPASLRRKQAAEAALGKYL